MYYFFISGAALSLILPRKACYVLAKIIAYLYFIFASKDRQAVAYNLLPIIDDPRMLNRCVKEVFTNFAYYLVDFFRYPYLNEDFVKKYVRIDGLDHLDNALTKGKGVVILTAHLGNYELGGAVTSLLGYPLSAVALAHKDKRVNRFFDGRRRMVGMEVIPTGLGIRGCFSALRKGKVIALLGDKDFSGSEIKLKIFSCKACIPRGASFFALKLGSEVIPSFFIRENKYFYRLIFEKPINIDEKKNDSETCLLKQYILVLEKYLKKYPGQWYMFQKYWLGS